jgi:hypothetical protein
MLKFGQRVRISLAKQFVKLSWAGAVIFSFFGWTKGVSGMVVVGIVVWWLAFQVFAHVLLAYEDSNGDSNDDSN